MIGEGALGYDFIVVGGGTAGSILAARLSEERDRTVLLLEAGPDYPDAAPAELLDASAALTSGHNWDFQAFLGDDEALPSEQMGRVSKVFQLAARHLAGGQGAPRPAPPAGGTGARFPYPMGKVMGGGSAVNGAMAFHARPEDYASWAAAGNGWWSWERSRPYIERIESAGAGKSPLPLETAAPGELSRFQRAFFETCLELGEPEVDLRQGSVSGVGFIPKNVAQGRRVSTASLYLTAARDRPNLTIQPRCLVDRLLFESRNGTMMATGVEALLDGRRARFSGGQILLAAGAINSPAILLRSGVGAAEEITRAGGRPLLDLPGVGKHLMEHPTVSLWGVPKAGTCAAGEPVHQMLLQRRSGGASEGLCDLQLFMLSALPTKNLPPLRDVLGADLAVGISVLVATPGSQGRIELLDGDPTRSPRIYLGLLKDAGDLRRMMEGVRYAWRILEGRRFAAGLERVVLWSRSVLDSDNLLEKMIRSAVRGAWHPVGTLRMGPEGDAMAVVDQQGRLRGCGNVTVADGSILPLLPSVPTNLTCMLVAERIAAHLRGQERAEGARG